MRKITILLGTIIGLMHCNCACAHEHTEELEHHWEGLTYINEMRFQIALMAAIATVIIAASWIKKLKKNRSIG